MAGIDLVIVGASARGAAFSARRAGLRPAAVDLFADRDLAAVAPCARVELETYPGSLVRALAGLPSAPWLYTGALENHPEVLDALAALRPLRGNSPAVVRAVRDPWRVADVVRAAGFAAPPLRESTAGPPRDGTWLRKPRASGGGMGIVSVEGDLSEEPSDASFYFQRRIVGHSLSATYIGLGGSATLAGVSTQLLGRVGAPFAYRGSLAPARVSEANRHRLATLGAVLSRAFGLLGIFGVDLVIDRDDIPWLIEINPRYTASVEVIELASGRALLDAHLAACEGRAIEWPEWLGTGRHVAKEVVYAPRAAVLDRAMPFRVPGPFERPTIADVPYPGTSFQAGDPVLTVFAQASRPDKALQRLARARRGWLTRLGWLTGS